MRRLDLPPDGGVTVTWCRCDTLPSGARPLSQWIFTVLEPAFSPSGLPFAPVCRYTRRLSKVRQRVLPAMEINPILNTIKDLYERSETIRGYL